MPVAQGRGRVSERQPDDDDQSETALKVENAGGRRTLDAESRSSRLRGRRCQRSALEGRGERPRSEAAAPAARNLRNAARASSDIKPTGCLPEARNEQNSES